MCLLISMHMWMKTKWVFLQMHQISFIDLIHLTD